jgi:predicted AlkP superfamily phosphohydrolase/phosphomutase
LNVHTTIETKFIARPIAAAPRDIADIIAVIVARTSEDAMDAKARVVFLGICAGDRDLIFQGARAGELPVLGRMLDRGLLGLTNNVPLFYVQSVWPSFFTGVRPDKHGVHSWQQLRPGTYEQYRAYTPDLIPHPPFWDLLSRTGRSCAVLDVPQTKPSEAINGIQLVEWGAHDANHGFRTSPPELAGEVVARFGVHPQRGLCDADRTPAQLRRFADDLLVGVRKKAEMTRYFLDQGGWDFFAQVFTEAHCVGHQCWHLHDPGHPRHDRRAVAIAGNPVRDVYAAIDRALGAVLDGIDEDTLTIVYSGHGFAAKYQGQYALAEILVRLGYAVPAAPSADPTPNESVARRVLSWGWRNTPDPLRRLIRPGAPRRAATREPPLRRELDPAASRCFVIPNNNYGGIRVNLAGREPAGIVRPGADYETFCAALTRDLLELVNLADGKPLVRRVLRTADVYASDATTHFPDLLVEWAAETEVSGVASPKIGELRRGYAYCRTGDHRPGGFFVACGPGVRAGVLPRPVSILDFAPTFCSIFDVAPGAFDGAPIPELVSAGRRTRPPEPTGSQLLTHAAPRLQTG